MSIAIDRYDRLTVARPADANLTGVIRARQPGSVVAMRRLRAAGVHVEVIAEQFGVSKRTAYRYLRAGTMHTVEISGWVAEFEIRPGETPVRVSVWRAL